MSKLPELTVVVPTRNAADLLPDCLASVRHSDPAEVIVVDGCSTDGTVGIAQQFGARVISDDGLGLPAARTIGARAANTRYVAFVDADVVLPEGALAALFAECVAGGYVALAASQHSVGGPGYWGRALVQHHNTGRSRAWFVLVTTIVARDALLDFGFDDRFASGEDIDLRWRLRRSGARMGVSDRVEVIHRYAGDDFEYARAQFLADGAGLGRMVRTRGLRAAPLLGLPAAAAARGIVVSLRAGEPQWLRYYLRFAQYNYLAMARAIADG